MPTAAPYLADPGEVRHASPRRRGSRRRRLAPASRRTSIGCGHPGNQCRERDRRVDRAPVPAVDGRTEWRFHSLTPQDQVAPASLAGRPPEAPRAHSSVSNQANCPTERPDLETLVAMSDWAHVTCFGGKELVVEGPVVTGFGGTTVGVLRAFLAPLPTRVSAVSSKLRAACSSTSSGRAREGIGSTAKSSRSLAITTIRPRPRAPSHGANPRCQSPNPYQCLLSR
jgi:hypothetical protein